MAATPRPRDPRRQHRRRHRRRPLRGRCRDQGRPHHRSRQGFGPRARKRSTPGASWWRRALSTSTPIMTARSPGARTSRPPRRTASPPRSWAIAASASRRAGRPITQRLIQLMEGVEDIPGAGAERRHSLGLGKFPGLHGMAVEAAFRHRHRRATAARGAARLCDGRTRRAPRSRRPPKTTRRWRRWRATRCAPARWVSRPRAP